jgi:hypothetical protein
MGVPPGIDASIRFVISHLPAGCSMYLCEFKPSSGIPRLRAQKGPLGLITMH